MFIRLSTLLLAGTVLTGIPSIAQPGHDTHHPPAANAPATKGQLLPVSAKDAAWLTEARRNYPLVACLVSDESLGSMGTPPEHIYRVAGNPDRLVRFCCSGCEDGFMADPETHLAKVEQARARHSAPNPGSAAPSKQ